MWFLDFFWIWSKVKPEWKSWDNLDLLELTLPDLELIKISNEWMLKGEKSKKELDRELQDSITYYKWNQLWVDKRISDNRIFLSIETIIPITTSNTPVPNVVAAQDTIESKMLAEDWTKILMSLYRTQKMQRKLERWGRHLILWKYAVFKYFYDEVKEKIETRVCYPSNLFFDNNRDIDDWFDWIWERLTATAFDLIERFPKKEKLISDYVWWRLWTEISYTEFWTNDFVFWRFDDKILSKIKNPNWNWKNNNDNFFDNPKVPYVVINLFDLWDTISWSTWLVDQAKTLQDWVDKRKNQIDMNASIVNWKVIWTAKNWLKQDEFASVDWTNSNEWIFFTDWEIGDIQRVSWTWLPQFVENDMLHSISEVDNIMWTHWTTRWEREGRETATWRSILRENDRWRIDIIWRRLEEAIEEIFNWWTQLVKVWYKDNKIIRVLWKDKAQEFFNISHQSIESWMEIYIIPWTLVQEDSASRANRATVLANSQMIDPITLYEELWMRNPKEVAKNLFLWQNDPQQLFEWTNTGQWNEQILSKQTQQAETEMRAMLQWKSVPPYEQADANHIAVHQAFMSSPDAKNLPVQIKQIIMQHLEQELPIVEWKAKQTVNQ